MATIMEGALWTLTEAAAKRMEANGLIYECTGTHCVVEDFDAPLYHIAADAPMWFGVHSIPDAIRIAEAHVVAEEVTGVRLHEMSLDPTMHPEPGGPGSIKVVNKDESTEMPTT